MVTPKIFIFYFCVLTLLFVGCVNDVANRYYVEERYPEKEISEVDLLWEQPDREFTVIADFQSRGEKPKHMRKKAAEIGADAVIVTLLGGFYDTTDDWAGNERQSESYTRIVGTAIKYN